jgi:hypothetical protein
MRISLIILSIIALIFIGSISWSLVSQGGWRLRTPSLPSSTANDVDNITLETWKNQIKSDEKIERLTEMVEELAKKNGVYTDTPTDTPSTINTGAIEAAHAVRPSGKLLAMVMPTASLLLTKNIGIYGLYVFDGNIKYSTYTDKNIGLTVIPLEVSYDVFLRNMKALGGKPY